MTDRYCDLIMEGGVTSGVVYPKAIVKLSRQFLFHSIGGASAGAIAAAATAAAEYRRRLSRPAGDMAGFDLLEKLPDELAPPRGRPDKESHLFGLFSPQKKTASLFAVLASALNRKGPISRNIALGAGFFRAYWFTALAVFLIVLGLARLGAEPLNALGWMPMVLLGVLVALIAVLVRIFLDLTGPFIGNGFGVCRGYNPGDETKFAAWAKGEPLTLWLSRLINRCAGLADDGPPLTFGMLWKAPGFPPDWLKEASSGKPPRGIDLRMVSTSLTHGRPFQFPDVDSDVPFYLALDELENYFPPNVMACLRGAAGNSDRGYGPTTDPDGKQLIALPLNDLPVIVAARMSLSFPFLLSAVPLYSVDFMPGHWMVKRCWFSDGGLTSNFPIHFFDSPLPLWPTFGISLEDQDPEHLPEDVWMPGSNTQGRADPWDDFDARPPGMFGGAKPLFGFVGAILGSIRNWQDRLTARSPGVRDRIVRIRLLKDEGGLNLAMSRDQIAAVAKKGEKAGDELLARYCGIGKPLLPLQHPMDLDNHRWVRLRALIGALERDAPGLHAALNATMPGAPLPWDQLITFAETIWARDPDRCPVKPNEATLIRADIEALNGLANATGTPPGTASTAPRRQPVLRLRPEISSTSNGYGGGRGGT